MVEQPIVFTRSERHSRTILGFWLYLLTDCLMFGAFFATYVVLRTGTHDGPGPEEIFHLWHAFGVSVLLLTAALFAGLAKVEALRGKKMGTMLQLGITLIIGSLFLGATFSESANLLAKGYSWQTSAFLSAFFTVIWVHGFHILAAIIWSLVLLGQLYFRGITEHTFRRLNILSMFWQFLSILWVFTFTIVYLMGIGGL